ncbi:heat shock factor protein 5-like isoform X2 [Erpetoichthys calabaricus]|uniref:heat shock factor protein 5-like isoform X2 n=1 Tax=Erpetoichthys calabaricus TaxID=27687 RepID=UPI002234919F|nr:heat shock factor protein 5-like isoform X2 [Erpetoichthys calabaricus]
MKSLHSYKPVFNPRQSGVVMPVPISHPVIGENLLSIPISPNNFPAKLWRLVNNPDIQSINWNPNAEGVVIHQKLFESELLSPVKFSVESSDGFKTSNFTSFIRQMNLYGFRKLPMNSGSLSQSGKFGRDIKAVNGSACKDLYSIVDEAVLHTAKHDNAVGNHRITNGAFHYYLHPNFKKGHPELLVNVKRLTGVNKAKLKAGIEVTCRQPSQKRKYLSYSFEFSEKERLENQDLEQVHQPLHPSESPANQIGLQCKKNLEEDPVLQPMWSNSPEAYMRENDRYFSKHGTPVSHMEKFLPQASNTMQFISRPQHAQLDSSRTMDQNFDWCIIPSAQLHPASCLKEMCYGCPPSSFNSVSTNFVQHFYTFPHYNSCQMPCPVWAQKSANPRCQCTSSCLVNVDTNLFHGQMQPESTSKEQPLSNAGNYIPDNTLSQMIPIPPVTPSTLKNSQMPTAPKSQTDGTACSVSISDASGIMVSPLQEQSSHCSQSWISCN